MFLHRSDTRRGVPLAINTYSQSISAVESCGGIPTERLIAGIEGTDALRLTYRMDKLKLIPGTKYPGCGGTMALIMVVKGYCLIDTII